MSRFSRRSIPAADRISNLPDPILCSILSLLPTKLATSTTILSKRWKSLYLSLSSLDFDDQTFTNFRTFRHFVYAIMLSHNPNVRLQSFHFKSGQCTHFDQYDINRFVNHAVQSGIQNLNLNILACIKLPPSVFNCKTLTVLKLEKLQIVDLPSVVDFPLLKTLVLVLVTFECHKFLINLLLGCPVLEDLHTERLIVDQYLSFSIPPSFHWGRSSEGKVQSLPNLVRANVSNLDIPFKLLYKAESLRVLLHCLYFPDDFGFDKLTKLELVFTYKYESHFKWKWLAELLNHCPKLQNLTFHEVYADELNSYVDWTEPENVPECLSSQLRTCLLGKYKGTECEFQFAKYILRKSKVLHTMTIQSDSSIILENKHEMLMRLSLCKRGSASCELVFD